MKKKLSILLIVVLTCVFMLAGCNFKTSVLDNTDGDVISTTNGSAVVEKGDYLYFINGKVAVEDANEFGKVTKGSLVRIGKSQLSSPSQDAVEVVIPKLFITGQFNRGVYFYGDNVYFATPSDKKNASGQVKNTQTEFYKFDLTTGKMDKKPIATATDNTTDYIFTEKDGVVYLVYTYAEVDGENTKNYIKVVNTQDKKEWTSSAYQEVLLPEDNSNNIFFTIVSDSKELAEDVTENFHDLYSYTVGDEDAKICLSGAGSYAIGRGDRNQEEYPLVAEGGFSGFTITLIKNTGKYLFYSITKLDDNSIIYFAVDYINNGTLIKNFDNDGKDNKIDEKDYTFVKELGYSDNLINNAITNSSFVKGINEIYYVDTYYGLRKYDYTQGKNDKIETIFEGCKDYTLYSIEGNLFYFADANGFYYVLDINAEDKELYKLNGVEMTLADAFFKPTVVNANGKKYFLGVYTAEYCYNYLYCIDITDAMQAPVDDEETSKYQQNLEEYGTMDREKTLELNASLLGKMTTEDSDAFDAYIEETYPEEE